MTEDEALPCPFCGGEPYHCGNERAGYVIRCKSCEASSGRATDYSYQAIEQWNRRVKDVNAEAAQRIFMLEADLRKARHEFDVLQATRLAQAGQTGGPADPAPSERADVGKLMSEKRMANHRAREWEAAANEAKEGMAKLQSALKQVTEEKREAECWRDGLDAECLAVQKRHNALAELVGAALAHLAGAPCGKCIGTGTVHHSQRGELICSACGGSGLAVQPIDVVNARNVLRQAKAVRANDAPDGERAHAAPCAPPAAPSTEDRLALLERFVSILMADRLSPPSKISASSGTVAKPLR